MKSIDRLPGLISEIESDLAMGEESNLASGEVAYLIVSRLKRDEGAAESFTGGAYVLRLAGVAGSCTAGCDGMLRSWLRAAHRKLEKAGRL